VVKTGVRNIKSTMKTPFSKVATTSPDTVSRIEMDNHADTTCFGKNFTAVSFTGTSCEVLTFSKEYKSLENIPVATAATAWDNPETGETIILVYNQGLWFGNTLEESLINPNQC